MADKNSISCKEKNCDKKVIYRPSRVKGNKGGLGADPNTLSKADDSNDSYSSKEHKKGVYLECEDGHTNKYYITLK